MRPNSRSSAHIVILGCSGWVRLSFKLRALPSLSKTFDAESCAPLLTNKKTRILTRHKTKKTMPTLTKLFPIQEVSLHNSKDDCWVVIDGKVYDVTTYLDDHPGGDEAILVATGKDATDDFEDAGHSNDARELMKSFCIGELDMSTIPELDVSFKKQQKDVALKLMDLTRQYWVVPVAIVGISVVATFLYMRQK